MSVSSLRVLIGCESSGNTRNAFRALGHAAWSCDILPADDASPYHYQADVFDVIAGGAWDLAIFHPPCTYLSSSGMHWTTRGLRDPQLTEDALAFVQRMMDCGIPAWAVENPIGCISTRIRKPDQIIQPWQFGHDASKATCLWLKNLPRLHHTKIIEPRIVNGKKRWGNQTDGGQNKLPPSADRWKLRSETYPGISAAMAGQWGGSLQHGDLA